MQKNLKYLIGGIIILLLLISDSILYTALKKSANDIKGLRQRNTELEKENQNLKNKAPLGWKEYTNQKNGFKIWYPLEALGYKISIDEKNANNISFVLGDQSSLGLSDAPTVFFTMHMYSKNEPDIKKIVQEELREKLENTDSADKYLNNIEQYITEEKINGIAAYKAEFPENIISYFVKKNNLVFVLNFNGQMYFPEEDTDTLKTYFTQIAQSFKLTE